MTRGVPANPTVLFVCRHGAAKSVLAVGCLRSLAADRGVQIAGASAGIEPDDEVSPAVIDVLGGRGRDLADQKPRRVRPDELSAARWVITFGLEPGDLPAAPQHVERWDDIPPVSDDPWAAKDAIERRLGRFLDRFAAAGGTDVGPPR